MLLMEAAMDFGSKDEGLEVAAFIAIQSSIFPKLISNFLKISNS